MLFPDFPSNVRSRLRSGTTSIATVTTPDGAEFICKLKLLLAHYNVRQNEGKSGVYRFVVELSGISKAELKIGSDVFIESEEIASALDLNRRTIQSR